MLDDSVRATEGLIRRLRRLTQILTEPNLNHDANCTATRDQSLTACCPIGGALRGRAALLCHSQGSRGIAHFKNQGNKRCLDCARHDKKPIWTTRPKETLSQTGRARAFSWRNRYKIRQRGWPVLLSVSHKRQPPEKALRLSPLFTPRDKRAIFFTFPPPSTTTSATNESFSCFTQ